MKIYLRPLSYVYNRVVSFKNSLYDRGVFKLYQAPVPVISIGNLTMGGTGKTPLTDYCLKNLVQKGKKVAVISRSYRADAESPVLVDASHPYAAKYFGDEPVLLAAENPEVDVYVGPRKWQTAQYAVSEGEYDFLIVDDGFQHRRLFRDLNIVILDATENFENYQVLPEGRAREPWKGIDRADVIVLTKCNLADQESLKFIEQNLPKDKEVLYFDYRITQLQGKADQILSVSQLKDKKIFLVSAIARPDVFEKMMRELGEVSRKSLHFRDHHQYKSQDAQKIQTEFENSGADYLVTTEKDAIKLRNLMDKNLDLWSASLEIAEQGKKGRLSEIIDQVGR